MGLREMELNFGPQHPSTHGVLRLVLKVDGEKLISVRPDVGYLHRGTEKLFETETYPMVIPHTDRLDYVASATNNHAYCLVVEKLLGIAVPKRAQYIRVLLDELQRISSHLLWLASAALDLGAITPFFYTFREREVILDLFEDYCGARLTLNCMRIGGLPVDLPPGWTEKVRAFAETFEARVDEYEDLLTENRIWKNRTIGIGVLPADRCIAWGVTGPTLRGAGVRWDVRRAFPYECYPEIDFEIPVGKNADTYDRYLVRMAELRQSRRIVTQCLDWLEKNPGTEFRGKVPRVIKPPAGEAYASVEAPKGELGFHLVSSGGNKPYRLRIRPPSFVNLQALPEMAQGHLVSDLVAVIGTIDIVLGEVDR
ncbi:NADH-quinone oxidoreductase subunit D [Acidobacteria bacterium ACD]|nr:MAG: NADH-quinone oxidoreductase subunit D [Acidobacteriota bacterium]MDL1948318.1 NADH-quinone oxidoreductase subunit D [Acidobacteria bacterium ACD]